MRRIERFGILSIAGIYAAGLILLCLSTISPASAGCLPPSSPGDSITLEEVIKLRESLPKMTTLQKQVWAKKYKNKMIVGKGQIMDARKDESILSKGQVIILIKVEQLKRDVELRVSKASEGRAACLSKDQVITFRGKLGIDYTTDYTTELDKHIILTNGSFE